MLVLKVVYKDELLTIDEAATYIVDTLHVYNTRGKQSSKPLLATVSRCDILDIERLALNHTEHAVILSHHETYSHRVTREEYLEIADSQVCKYTPAEELDTRYRDIFKTESASSITSREESPHTSVLVLTSHRFPYPYSNCLIL